MHTQTYMEAVSHKIFYALVCFIKKHERIRFSCNIINILRLRNLHTQCTQAGSSFVEERCCAGRYRHKGQFTRFQSGL